MIQSGCHDDAADVGIMTELRKRLKEYERAQGTRVICPSIRYRCRYCPLPAFGKCKKLENYLATGSWKKVDRKNPK